MKNSYLLWVLGVLLAWSSYVFAQDSGEHRAVSSDAKAAIWVWQESISDLRRGAQTLIDAHDKLTEENGLLFTELANLQKSIDQAKQDSQRLAGDPARINRLIGEETAKEKPLAKNIKDLETKLQAMTRDNQKLQEKLAHLSEKLKPWEDQMAGLNAKKMHLEVELKLDESLPADQIQQLAAEVNSLQSSLSEGVKKEQDLKSAIDEAAQALGSSGESQKDLRTEIARLKNERKNTFADIEDLKKKNEALEKSTGKAQSALLQEKGDLENASFEIQADIASLKQMATGEDAGKIAAEKEKVLHEALQALEKENQDLENRIFDLSQAIDTIKKDNAMIEALLRSGKDGEMPSMSPFDNITEAVAYAYAYHGMYEEAIAKYEQALKQGGEKRNIYFNLGYIYTQMGNADEALRYYKNVLKIDPRDHEAKRNIAQLREGQKGKN